MKTRKHSVIFLAAIAIVLYSCNSGNKNQKKEVQKEDSVSVSYSLLEMRLVRKAGKIGFVDSAGKEIIPCVYDSIVNCDYDNDQAGGVSYFSGSPGYCIAKVQKDGKWGIINSKGNVIIPCTYDGIRDFNFHKTGRVEGPYIDFFSWRDGKKNSMAVVRKGDKWGLINKQGKVFLRCLYDEIYSPRLTLFYGGRVGVKQNGLWGFLDTAGRPVIPCVYEQIGSRNYGEGNFNEEGDVYSFYGGISVAKKDGKWGAIDENGNEKVPFVYDFMYSWSDSLDLTGVQKEGAWGFIDKAGNVAIPIIYDAIRWFEDGLCAVKRGKWGFIDRKGEVVIPLIYDEIQETFEINGISWGFVLKGYCAVKKEDGKWGLLNAKNETIINFVYDEIKNISIGMHNNQYFYKGYLIVRKGRYYGLVNSKGREIVPCKYDEIRDWTEAYAKVKKNGKYGIVDRNGKTIVPTKYDNLYGESNGMFCVEDNKKYGFFTLDGKKITACVYDKWYDLNKIFTLVFQNGKTGFIVRQGEVILPCIYETNRHITSSEGNVDVMKDGKWIQINSKGEEIEK
jgi:hypothetical protein